MSITGDRIQAVEKRVDNCEIDIREIQTWRSKALGAWWLAVVACTVLLGVAGIVVHLLPSSPTVTVHPDDLPVDSRGWPKYPGR